MPRIPASKKPGVCPSDLAPHLPICDAIAELLSPYAEVVLHDLRTETVCYVANNISKRAIGDPSLLHEIDFKRTDRLIGPYEKINWDGRRIKSVSAIIRRDRRAIGIICINVDVSYIFSAMEILGAIAKVPDHSHKPAALFKEDWHERINEYIQTWTTERKVSVSNLMRAEKRELVRALANDGAFGGRHAASYISRVLGIGRATVYNYLRQAEAGRDCEPDGL